MATYEYVCKECDSTVDISHPIDQSPVILCGTCSKPRRKKFSLGAVTFKGGGWGKS